MTNGSMIGRRPFLAGGGAALAGLAGWGGAARAQAAGDVIRLGVITDMSGPFADLSGQNSVAATRLAAQEAAAQLGLKVEVLAADHQNKPDVASNIARQWFDRDGVDALVDVPASSAALSVAGIVKEKNKVFLASSPGTSELTGRQCNANTVQWTYDTWMLANSTCRALVAEGGDSWYFVVADYAFGHAMEADGTRFITQAGGKVLGATRYPFPATTDFSAFLLRAQASRAKVVGFAFGGNDLVTAVKQAGEFGITRGGQRIACLIMFISEVKSLGLPAAQGLICSETFYWDLNDRTRAFSQRLRDAFGTPAPTMVHAGCYAAPLHYLKAVKEMGVARAKASGAETMARMKAMPTDDDAFGRGRIREDGRKLNDALLLQVKSPAESRGPWDLYKLLRTTPAEEAFRPLSEGGCPLVRS